MPVYEYACTDCDEQLEVRQSFTDDALTVCPSCSGRLRKVLSAVGVVFKGSGFYRNDSRAAASSSNASKGDGTADSNGSSGDKAGKADSARPDKTEKASSGSPSRGDSTDSSKSTSAKKSSTAKAAAN